MVKELVHKSKFAVLAGVTPAAVSKACKNGLAPAVAGKRIDAAHPAAVAYLARHTGSAPPPASTKKKPTKPALRAKGKPPDEKSAVVKKSQPVPVDIDAPKQPWEVPALLDTTLRDIIARYGSTTGFVDWLTSMKLIESITGIRLKNAETEGKLVSRKLVKDGIIDPIDAAHRRLLTDGAKTMAVRSKALLDSGRPLEDVEEFFRDQIASFIKPVKARVRRTLQNG